MNEDTVTNPYNGRRIPTSSIEGRRILKLRKACKTCDEHEAFDFSKERCVKVTQKNKKRLKDLLEFCNAVDREALRANPKNMKILKDIRNIRVPVIKKNGKSVTLDDIIKASDKSLQKISIPNFAGDEKTMGMLISILVAMIGLFKTSPEAAESVENSILKIIGNTSGFIPEFLGMFIRSIPNSLKDLLSKMNPITLLTALGTIISKMVASIFERTDSSSGGDLGSFSNIGRPIFFIDNTVNVGINKGDISVCNNAQKYKIAPPNQLCDQHKTSMVIYLKSTGLNSDIIVKRANNLKLSYNTTSGNFELSTSPEVVTFGTGIRRDPIETTTRRDPNDTGIGGMFPIKFQKTEIEDRDDILIKLKKLITHIKSLLGRIQKMFDRYDNMVITSSKIKGLEDNLEQGNDDLKSLRDHVKELKSKSDLDKLNNEIEQVSNQTKRYTKNINILRSQLEKLGDLDGIIKSGHVAGNEAQRNVYARVVANLERLGPIIDDLRNDTVIAYRDYIINEVKSMIANLAIFGKFIEDII